jgi:hypothetical protein
MTDNKQMALLTPEAFERLPAFTKFTAKREAGELAKNVMLDAMRDSGKALLASSAMNHLGTLSSLEENLTQLAPSGVHRYRAIADAYTMSVAQDILRR